MANIPDYNFPTDPRGMTVLMTNHDLQDYEQNVKQIRSMVLDNNTYINDLQDGDFAVFTTANDYRATEGLWDGYTPFPTQQVQNPQGIFRVDSNGIIACSKSGQFDVSYCLQVTTGATKEVKSSSVRIKLIEEPSGTVLAQQSVTLNRTATANYPAIIGTFADVFMGLDSGTTKNISIAVEIRDATPDVALTVGMFDPYKNYIAIDPSGSQSKAGLNIAKTLRNTLAGLSFRSGLEVRATVNSSNQNVVYAEPYNPATKVAS